MVKKEPQLLDFDNLARYIETICLRTNDDQTDESGLCRMLVALNICVMRELSAVEHSTKAFECLLANTLATIFNNCERYQTKDGIVLTRPRRGPTDIVISALYLFATFCKAPKCQEAVMAWLFDSLRTARSINIMPSTCVRVLVEKRLDSAHVLASYGTLLKWRGYPLQAIECLTVALRLLDSNVASFMSPSRHDVVLSLHWAQLDAELWEEAEKSIVSIRDVLPVRYGYYLLRHKGLVAEAAEWYGKAKSWEGLRELSHMTMQLHAEGASAGQPLLSDKELLAYFDAHIATAAKVAMMITKREMFRKLTAMFTTENANLEIANTMPGCDLIEKLSTHDPPTWLPTVELCSRRAKLFDKYAKQGGTIAGIPRLEIPSACNSYSLYEVGLIVEKSTPDEKEVARWCYEMAEKLSWLAEDEGAVCAEKIKMEEAAVPERKRQRDTRSGEPEECSPPSAKKAVL